MNKTIQCPVCNGAIGFWTLTWAPTPTRYRCPKCKSRLQLAGRKWPIYLAGCIYGIPLGIIFILVKMFLKGHIGDPLAVLTACVVVAISVILCEIPISFYVLRKRSLEKTPEKKPTAIFLRAVTIVLFVVSIVLGARLAFLLIQFKHSQEYTTQLVRSHRALAVALHQEHFNQDPSSLHILWKNEPKNIVPGVTTHTMLGTPLWEKDDRNLPFYLTSYNYPTVGQACYLALHGEDSLRVRRVLEVAKQLYRGSTESELLDLLEELKQGDAEAAAKFEQVFKWCSSSFVPDRQYFKEVLMPHVNEWAGQLKEDHNSVARSD